MIIDYENEDPFFIEDWEDFCKYCIENGKMEFFKSTLRDYIHEIQKPMRESVVSHVNMLYGETVIIARINEEKMVKARKLKNSASQFTNNLEINL